MGKEGEAYGGNTRGGWRWKDGVKVDARMRAMMLAYGCFPWVSNKNSSIC